jgi:branched-chain amino acid transport system substrate-binding protein
MNKQRLLLATTLAALVSGAASAQGLKVGALMPLTGGLQAYGEACLNGVRMAADELNAAGGVLGGEVQLSVADTQTRAQPAIDAAKRLTSVEGVSGIVGALSSGNTIPVAQTVASVDRVPMISPASTAPTITTLEDDDFLFRTIPSDALQGVALAQVVSEQGLGKVAILYVNNDYGDGLAGSFTESFTARGGEVTASEAFEPNKASYRGELQNVARGGPEALLLIAYPDDGGITILRQSLEEGFFNNFVFTDGMKAEKVVETIGADFLEGAFGTAPKAEETPEAASFQSMYEAKFGELPPRPFIDSSYDAMAILALAAARAGSTDGTAIRDAIREVANAPGVQIRPGELAKGLEAIANGEEIDYVGAAGDHEFDDDGDVSGTFEHWVISGGALETVTIFAPGG